MDKDAKVEQTAQPLEQGEVQENTDTNAEVGSLIADAKRYRKRSQEAEAKLNELQTKLNEQEEERMQKNSEWQELAAKYKSERDEYKAMADEGTKIKETVRSSLLEQLDDEDREFAIDLPTEKLQKFVNRTVKTKVNTNEFATVASLYESGKYDLIESDKSITTLSNTFSYQNASSQVNDLIYHNLSPVRSLTFSTGDVPEAEEFFISGSWTDPNGSNAIGYQAILQTPTSKDGFDKTTENTFVVFSGGLKEDVGTYSLRVKALGAGADNSLALNAYYDSTFAVHNKFLVPEENLNHDESFLENFTIN